MLKQKNCQQCQTLFMPRNDSPGIFCSKSCNAKYHNAHRIRKEKLPDRNCLQCNSLIFKPNKFCNQSCAATYNNARRETTSLKHNCQHCGISGVSSHAKYCSNKCSVDHNRKYTKDESAIIKKNRCRETSANYRAKVRNQTPITADRKAIRQFYADCPVGFEIDHIIPISKGGLHDLSNLQYLTITENRRKSNKII